MKKRKIDPLEEIMSNPYYQLRDEYNDAEKIKWTMSFAQYRKALAEGIRPEPFFLTQKRVRDSGG